VKLEQSFEVDAPLDVVWKALIDVERVAPCLPGAEVHGRNDDGSYDGSFAVKLGPATASYRGTLHMEDVDDDAHTATMRANGSDKRGQGGAKATIVSSVRPNDAGGTTVDVFTDYSITGRLARFGRGGMIQDVSERLLREFATCLQANLGTQAPAPDPSATVSDAAAGTADPSPDAPAPPMGAPSTGAAATGAAETAAPGAEPFTAPKSKPVSGFRLLLGALRDRLRRWRRSRAS
jgi:carbon monoxide dehydrogenase subunit G